MKLFLCLLALLATSQAKIDWDSVKPISDAYPHLKLKNFPVKHGNQGRIVGGEEAKIHQFPYQVALFIQIGPDTYFCGGSLITKSEVLTAGHCVFQASNFTVILGAHNIREEEPDQVSIGSSEAFLHEAYDPNEILNDIAIIKLPKNVQLNKAIQLARLPSRSQEKELFVGKQSTVSGWGRDSDNSQSISPVLRYTSTPIITNKKCNKLMLNTVKDTNICASGEGGKSACNGDSGGPLTVEDDDGHPIEVGMVSFGLIFGCEVGIPSAYTRITSYLDWIEEHSSLKIRP